MDLMEVADRPAIRHDVAFEAPFVAQHVEEKMICARRFAANGVVRAHDRIGLALHDRGAKSGSVSVCQIVGGHRHVEAMPQKDRKSTRLNSSHCALSRMPSSA